MVTKEREKNAALQSELSAARAEQQTESATVASLREEGTELRQALQAEQEAAAESKKLIGAAEVTKDDVAEQLSEASARLAEVERDAVRK